MRIKKAIAPAVALAIAGALIVAPGSAGAATFHHMIGFAGGTAIKALGSTVESDLTSESSVDTYVPGPSQANTLLHVAVGQGHLANIGAVNTTANTTALDDGGVQVGMAAQTAGISLLDGAIVAKAVTTTVTATVHGDNSVDWQTHTEFVGLKIGSLHIPVNIPQNWHVSIPGVATVILNAGFAGAGPAGSGAIMAEGAGLYVSLLKPRGGSPIGTEVFLNPTYAAISTTSPSTGATIGGYAYGSKIDAKVGTLLNVNSGPTAQISLPIDGTGGKSMYNTTAGVSLPQVLGVRLVTDYAEGVKGTAHPFVQSYSKMTTQLANVNLLNGLITADALTGQAYVQTNPDGTTTANAQTSFVNLHIAGHLIPITVSPNTVINIANVGIVTIRKQATTANQALVRVLDIKITTASYGLPVGADIEVGTAAAWVVAA
jgi:hypothetical protein